MPEAQNPAELTRQVSAIFRNQSPLAELTDRLFVNPIHNSTSLIWPATRLCGTVDLMLENVAGESDATRCRPNSASSFVATLETGDRFISMQARHFQQLVDL